VRELRERLAAQAQLPSNYYINFGGQFEQQERAFEALALAIALAVGLVFVLLLMALGSVAEVSVILLTLPDAFVGGILALILTGETLNVSSAVGFIGLFGIAVQNGLVLIAQQASPRANASQVARSPKCLKLARRWCSKLCSERVNKRQIGTGWDRIAFAGFLAENRKIGRDSQENDRALVGSANRRFRPLSHLTARLQVYVTRTLTRTRSTATR
jgi:hypothetical protein